MHWPYKINTQWSLPLINTRDTQPELINSHIYIPIICGTFRIIKGDFVLPCIHKPIHLVTNLWFNSNLSGQHIPLASVPENNHAHKLTATVRPSKKTRILRPVSRFNIQRSNINPQACKTWNPDQLSYAAPHFNTQSYLYIYTTPTSIDRLLCIGRLALVSERILSGKGSDWHI